MSLEAVLSADVSCVSGTAICRVPKGTDTATLIAAIYAEGFDSSPKD